MTAINPFTESVLSPPSGAATEEHSSSVPLYLGDIRRRWVLVAAGALIGALSGGGYLALGQPVTATTDVDVSAAPLVSSSGGGNPTFDAGTDIELASSFPVASAAAAALGAGVDPAQLRRNVEVTAVDGTPIVHIAYTDESPAVARERADALARAYLGFRDDAVSGLGTDPTASGARSRILTSAVDNPVTTATTPAAAIASGVVAGGVLGAVLAIVLAVVRRRRSSRADIVRRVGPVLSDAESVRFGDGEALARLARERILLRAQSTLGTVAIIDLCEGNDGIMVPHDLATAFREIGWDCFVDRGAERSDDGDAEFAPLHLLSVGPRPLLADSLRAARGSDGVVIVHQTGRENVEAAATLAAELRAVGAQVLGVSLIASTGSGALEARNGADHD
jgi:hypothetical protein